MFTTYHVTQPDVLYSKNNQWAIPTGTSLSGATGQMEPYYVIMRLPGQVRDEFVQILPFVPNGRPNMIGWLAARSDMPNYGQAVSFAFPSNATVYGPTQVEAAVNQDPTVSQQLTLWNQQGSHVIIGNLLVIPIADSLLYVEPLYLQSSIDPGAPAQAGDRLLPGEHLGRRDCDRRPAAGGHAAHPGRRPHRDLRRGARRRPAAARPGDDSDDTDGDPPDPSRRRVKSLIAQANSEFQAAQAALKAGDFSGYGAQISALQATLKTLQGAK